MHSMRPFLGAAVLCSSQLAAAQEPVHHDVIAQIKAEALERSQVLATFNVLTNVIGPRLTATPAFKAAADWSAGQLVGDMQLTGRRIAMEITGKSCHEASTTRIASQKETTWKSCMPSAADKRRHT